MLAEIQVIPEERGHPVSIADLWNEATPDPENPLAVWESHAESSPRCLASFADQLAPNGLEGLSLGFGEHLPDEYKAGQADQPEEPKTANVA